MKKLPLVSVLPTTIETYIKRPLDTEKNRLSTLSNVLVSIEGEIRALLGSLGASDEAVGDTVAWLDKVIIKEGEKDESSLLEAFQVRNNLQAELSAREPGLESSLRSVKEELHKLEGSDQNAEAIEKAKEKVMTAQKLVDK